MATHDLNPSVAVEDHVFGPSGGIPNSSLPLLIYRGGLDEPVRMAGAAETILTRNRWQGVWVWPIYPFWHFHTKGHEVLACVAGRAKVGLGGEDGIEGEIVAGDVIVIPAGVGHRLLDASDDFSIVGAYPPGQEGDITKPEEIDFEEAKEKVAAVAIPATDPVFGREGPLHDYWPLPPEAAPMHPEGDQIETDEAGVEKAPPEEEEPADEAKAG
ncbi:cupin domain-containing protein [Afifella sp. IM 167]|uniref:cupin domain-containing protein n=1 Tax=Afifella sp. IM 167 TaxID=2033586 RepID=UPI001CCC8615|nr:cupin domain-containing protein [Afifella sp. IM 167]